jgi:integrase
MAFVWKHDSLKTPYWIARFTDVSGRRVNRSTKLENRKKAQAVADQWERAAKLARNRELTQAASVKVLDELMRDSTGEEFLRESIGDFFRKWMEAPGLHGERSPLTLKAYKTQIDGFLASLGPERQRGSITSLSAGEIQAWRDAELRAGKAAKTVNTAVNTLKAALESGVRKGVLLANPAKAVQKILQVGDERVPFTRQEVGRLLKRASVEWRGMILLGAFCGLRLTDAAGLVWENLDLKEKVLRFRPRKTMKTARGLEIPLHAQVVEALSKVPRGLGRAPVFPSLVGRASGSAGGLSNEFRRLMKKAGISSGQGSEKSGKGRVVSEKSFHSLRHYCVSELKRAGVSPDVSKRIVGHATDEAHERYTHLGLEDNRAGIEKLPRIG